jgi:hypothetical protein
MFRAPRIRRLRAGLLTALERTLGADCQLQVVLE